MGDAYQLEALGAYQVVEASSLSEGHHPLVYHDSSACFQILKEEALGFQVVVVMWVVVVRNEFDIYPACISTLPKRRKTKSKKVDSQNILVLFWRNLGKQSTKNYASIRCVL